MMVIKNPYVDGWMLWPNLCVLNGYYTKTPANICMYLEETVWEHYDTRLQAVL